MKLFTIFCLLFSTPYVYGQSIDSKKLSYDNLSSKQALTLLRNQIKRYVDSLMLVLLDEETPKENQIEILNEIRTIADINGQITIALNQVSQSNIRKNEIDTGPERNKNISVWVKNQAELIRRKQSELNHLEKNKKELDREFWVNLALDGIVIGAGSVLMFFTPAGLFVSIPLIAGRITLTGKKLGAVLVAIGAVRGGADTWNYLSEDEDERVFSFVSDIAFRDVLTRELFNMLSSVNPEDRYLAISLLQSASLGEETLTRDLLNIIQDENRSIEIRQPALRAVKAISVDNNEELKKEVIAVLKEIIDKSQVPSLRQTAVVILGVIGGGVSEEVAEYLEKIGREIKENDELRLIALIELGRHKDYFSISIEKLALWLKGRNYEKNPLNILLEFSDSLLESLLLIEEPELSDNHVTVLREFIRSDILNAELKIRFSETLLSWDDSLENKAFLRDYLNPSTDIRLYVENELFKEENLFEENYGAFVFLTRQINILENFKNPTRNLEEIETLIKEFLFLHPNQLEIAEKLEKIVNSYKNMLESIKN